MGVRGLQYYLEKCCQTASPNVSIPDLVTRNRRHSNNEELVIVVDGSSCIRHLYGNLEWIGGGQLKQFGEQAQHFVEAFADIGIHLVFFFDGPTVGRKRREWVERRMNTMNKMYFVLDKIAEGRPSHTIDKRNFQLPPGLGQLSRHIFEILCGCEVYQSLTECDEEIAEYARTHEVFAILGQDTDFVILNTGNALYLSMEKLNLNNMTTLLYDHQALADSLGIHTSQLPLLATFMGNDVVSPQDLKRFHLNTTGQHFSNQNVNFKILVPNLALYIRSLPYDRDSLFEMLADISRKVLGDPSRAEDIQASLHSYDSSPRRDYEREEQHRNGRWSRVLNEARQRHQNNQSPSMVYAIMRGLPFESSTSIEDFRRDDLPSFASATQPIRKRLYGILLQEKPLPPNGRHVVAEWCMAGPGSLDEAHYVSAEPSPRPHPGLLALWNDQGRLSSVRWQLFVHTVSPHLDVRRMRSTVPKFLIIPTLILFYIYNELEFLEPWEVDAMLATAAVLKYYDTARLAALPSDPISTRGVRVANLIMRSTFVLYTLLAACGYPLSVEDTAPWRFFDGKLFQIKYNQARSGRTHVQLCEHQVAAMEEFQLARRIALGFV